MENTSAPSTGKNWVQRTVEGVKNTAQAVNKHKKEVVFGVAMTVSGLIKGQCPTTPDTVHTNEIAELLQTGNYFTEVEVINGGYPDFQVDDPNHQSWNVVESEVANSSIDYKTLGNAGTITIHVYYPFDPGVCDVERDVVIVDNNVPDCTTLTEPTDGSTNVNITTDLSWNSVSGADGYKLNVGTSPGGTQIEDHKDVGNVTTYDPGDFPCGSPIYVTIIPYNSNGDATGCAEESFETESVTADAGPDEEFCDGGSVQLNASGGTTYSWSPTTGLDDPNIPNPVASPAATTTYTVTVSNDGRCPDMDDVIVTVNPLPVPHASATNETGHNYKDGTATSNPSNGTPAYTYAWSNGQNTQTITGLAPNDYTVTVTDSKTCSASETVTVAEYVCPAITVNASATDETANDANDGTATANPTGGTPAYTYAWSNGQNTQTITGLAPGDYTVTVTDSKACTASQTVTVAEFVCPTLTINATQQDAQCNGTCDGSITITGVTNGVAPFSYSWSNGATTASISGLCAGDYTVTVTDDKNCSVSETYTLSEPDALVPHASATDETGNNFDDGTATANPTGGTAAYTYAWSNGGNTQTITGLAPGNYTVTVTDDHGCTAEETVSVNEFICPSLTIQATVTNSSCHGVCDGQITIDDMTNGVAPFTYQWSNGATTQTISGLCPGTYDVTVTDAKNCSESASYTTTEPDVLVAHASATDETANDANDGTATANPTGGTTPYNYAWSNGGNTQTITGLAPGNYTVTVTDDNGCTTEETVSVAEFVCPSLSLTSTQMDNTCYNACDGEISITGVVNGVAPFTYDWSDGQSTQTATNLCAGDYTVTVTDDKNCSVVSQTFTITQPAALLPHASATDETANDANDGTATANPAGGTPGYTYAWSNGENTRTITGLAPGDYTVTVTDDNGCTAEETVTVAEYVCPTLTINATQQDAQCNGSCDGSITITGITNGIAPFTYSWSNGATTASISGLCAGDYTVTVTDDKNCSVSETYTVSEPDALAPQASATDETAKDAHDGTATAGPTGGTPGYTYDWSNGQNTRTITGLAPGTYTVTVTDSHDCTASQTVTVAEFVCPSLTINATQQNIQCNGNCDGSISITGVTNGVAPFSYSWSNGATTATISGLCAGDYAVTVTDDKNCSASASYTLSEPEPLIAHASATDETSKDAHDGTATANPKGGKSPYAYAWSNGENTQTITGLAPGSYTVTVTDDNDCSSVESVSVAEFGCQGLAIEISQTDVKCNGACDAVLEITGVPNGTSPFTYTWSNGKNTSKIDSLCPGNYSVTVTDANNCNVYGSYTVTEPELLVAHASATGETANGANDGTATSNASGGTRPYTYAWSNGQTTPSISGLAPGDYTVTVTDTNGCTAIDTVTVEKFICPELVVHAQSKNISCFEACDGSISVSSVDSAVAPLTYHWNTGANSASLSNLCAGDYSLTITDAKNCEVVQNFSLTQPDAITLTIDSTRDIRDTLPGFIHVSTGGSGHYTFAWSGPGGFTANTEDLDSLQEGGCYTLTITDTATHCSIDSTICLKKHNATLDLELGSIKIYPNPARDYFVVDFRDTGLSKVEITLYDLSGKPLVSIKNKGRDKVIKVASGALHSGIYLLKIKSAHSGSAYKKVIVHK